MMLQLRLALLGHPKPPTFLWPLQSVRLYATVVGTLAALIHVCRIIYLFLIYHFEKSNILIDSIIPFTLKIII
jgi:hypothetical protein